MQDGSRRHTLEPVHGRSQLDVGIFQHLLNPIADACLLFRQSLAIAHKVAQSRLLTRWHEAGIDLAVLEQLRNQLSVEESVLRPGTHLICWAFRSRAQVVLVNQGATPYDASVTLRVWNRYL